MLAAIGETLETPYTGSDGAPAAPDNFSDEVTGIIVSSRKVRTPAGLPASTRADPADVLQT